MYKVKRLQRIQWTLVVNCFKVVASKGRERVMLYLKNILVRASKKYLGYIWATTFSLFLVSYFVAERCLIIFVGWKPFDPRNPPINPLSYRLKEKVYTRQNKWFFDSMSFFRIGWEGSFSFSGGFSIMETWFCLEEQQDKKKLERSYYNNSCSLDEDRSPNLCQSSLITAISSLCSKLDCSKNS